LDAYLSFRYLPVNLLAGQPPPYNPLRNSGNPFRIGSLSIVEAKSLLIKIPDQVERLIQATLQQTLETPEVLADDKS
jgi:hypothetical protein